MSMTDRQARRYALLNKLYYGHGTTSASNSVMNDTPQKTLTPHQFRQLIIDRLESDTTLGLAGKLDPRDIDHLAGGLATVLAGMTIEEM